ncbi:MAG: DUF445 family protein [Spirochaetota bacterium]
MSDLAALLPWIVPPFLGAIIGYVTNAIAIKMLFRPLTEKRILGIRIPLTPGIIPKRRYELAESIARMVSRELLTAETLQKQIRSPKFQDGIGNSISNVTSSVLSTKLSKIFLLDDIHTDPDSYSTDLKLKEIIRNAFDSILPSPGFKAIIQNIIHRGLDHLFSLPLGSILSKIEDRPSALRRLFEILTSEKIHENILKTIDRYVEKQLQQNTRLESILTTDMADIICQAFNTVYPAVFSSFIRWLKKDSTRSQLEQRGRALVRDIQDKLNIIQKLIISAAQYEKTLDAQMPAIVDDLIQSLEDAGSSEENKKQIITSVKDGLMAFRDKGFRDLFAESSPDIALEVHNIAGNLLVRFKAALLREEFINTLAGKFESLDDRPLGELIHNLLGLEVPEIENYIFNLANRYIERFTVNINDGFKSVVSSFISAAGDPAIGEFLGLRSVIKKRIDTFLAGKAVALMEEKIPEVMQSLDVYGMVVEKINNLDVRDVERILLIVIEKHLKWINIFGGILGALIGMLQVVINIFS